MRMMGVIAEVDRSGRDKEALARLPAAAVSFLYGLKDPVVKKAGQRIFNRRHVERFARLGPEGDSRL